ncbi:hypothetical protein SDC9_93899 [bioreactor metagenome]|uniref:Uncharacterized protein n=1 Tax=bioreactor metagenome TaxID=1076179 RepID=A0A645A4L1_9ZZZZ
MLMGWDKYIITPSLYCDAQPAELVGNYSQLVISHILDCNLTGSHSRHPYETANLNHIGQDCMFGTTK